MTEAPMLINEIHRMKEERLLDLIRRATANGTHKEVAEAIARDWFPLCCVGDAGQITIKISGDADGEIESGSEK